MTTISKKVYKIRLKKGDNVVVRSGKYKGQVGKVVAVHPSLNKVTVEGINIVKRHQKPTKPIWVSKVGLYDAVSKKASRVAMKIDKEGNKVRVYASSKKEVRNG